ncbi:hypothetical protein [Acetobacter senegalensis]
MPWDFIMIKIRYFLFLFLALFCVFAAFRCWTVPNVLIFRSESVGDIYVPTFYPPTDTARLKFSDGAVSAVSVHPDSAPIVQSNGLSIYRVSSTSPFCHTTPKFCLPGREGGIVLSGQNEKGPVFSSSYAVLTEVDTSLSHLRHLVNKSSPSQRLFVVSLNGRMKSVKELQNSGGDFSINLRYFEEFSYKFLIYSFVSSALIVFSIYILLSPGSLRFFRELYEQNKFSSLFVCVLWLLFYICVFPSMFCHDTIIHNANAQIYTEWYSGLYFIYNSCVRIIGFEWIQLVPALAGLLSVLLLLRCGSLAMAGRPTWQKRLLSAATVGLFVCNPAIIISMFSQQRYFVVITVVFLAISLWFYGYFKSLSENRPFSRSLAVAVLVLCGLSWLLRAEYLAVFAVSILFFVFSKVAAGRSRLLVVAGSVCFIIFMKMFIDHAMPILYDYNKDLAKWKYLTVSDISMSYPYICQGQVDQELAGIIGYFAPAQKVCEVGPESFWWGMMSGKAGLNAVPTMRNLQQRVVWDIKNNWRPFLHYRWETGLQLFFGDIWQMDSRYRRRDIARATGVPVDINTTIPDVFGLINDHPATRGLNRDVISLYVRASQAVNIKGLVVIAVVSIVALATGWSWLTPLFSLLFVAMVVPIVLVAPTVNWAYLAFIPVWASFSVPLAVCEILVTQRYFKNYAPRGWLASGFLHMQRFVRFAALSGGCWALDAVTLLVLNHAAHLPPMLANMISSCLAASIVFLVSCRHIHGASGDGLLKRSGFYIAYTLLLIIVASTVLPVLMGYLVQLGGLNLTGGRLLLLAKIMITPPQLICNFFVSRLVAHYTFPSRDR